MFKEYIAHDIDNTFMNENEFCEKANINGVSVLICVDNDRLAHKIVREYDGVVIGDILFFITQNEFKKIPHTKGTPKVNDAIMFKNKPCIVTAVTEKDGMFEVVLQYSGGGR